MSNEINVIRELMTWIRTNTGKSVNFSVNHWSFKADGSETTEYKLWVDELISLIPSIKQYCTLNMELAA